MLSYAFTPTKTHSFDQGGQGLFYRARHAIHLSNCSFFCFQYLLAHSCYLQKNCTVTEAEQIKVVKFFFLLSSKCSSKYYFVTWCFNGAGGEEQTPH